MMIKIISCSSFTPLTLLLFKYLNHFLCFGVTIQNWTLT